MNRRPTQATLILTLTTLAVVVASCTDAPTLLDQGETGVRESAIVNGSVTSGYPAVGALHSGNQAACTATLVGKRTVLTAAHCVTTADPPYNLLQPVNFYIGGLYTGTKYSAVAVAVHPSYAGGNKSDVAVVRLSTDVTGVTPMTIASQAPVSGESVMLVGYGKTGENSGTFGTKRKASNVIGKIEAQLIRYYGASGASGNICNGDSGGPTFANRGGKEVMIGVHSTKGGVCGQEGNDMRVDVFHAWIAQQAQGDLYSGAPTDLSPPQVQILKPTPNAVLDPTFTVQVSASDDVGVTKVQLFINGTQASQSTSAPFTFNLQNLPLGKATIEAVAFDGAGRTASAVASVVVSTPGGTSPQNPGQLRPFGSSCSAGTQCQSKLCVNDGTAGLFCSQACSSPANCPGGYDCVQGICRSSAGQGQPQGPLTGSFGASCTSHGECTSGLCALDNISGRQFCTAMCDLSQNNCPGGAICHPAGQQAVCGLPAGADDALDGDESLDGGCSVSASGGATASPAPLLLGLALLGLALLRRRATRG